MIALTQTQFIPTWCISVLLLALVLVLAWGFIAALAEEPDETERTRPIGMPTADEAQAKARIVRGSPTGRLYYNTLQPQQVKRPHDWLSVPGGSDLTRGVSYKFCVRCDREEWADGTVRAGDGTCG